jgi:large subunit ribosomal protein L7/L12
MNEPEVQGSGDKGGGVSIAIGTPDEWSEDVVQIGDAIANLTLTEAVALSQYLEEVHGIKPASSGFIVPDQQKPEQAPEKAPEQTEFAVVVEGVLDMTQKVGVVKVWREITGMGLKESMEAVTKAPATVKEGVSREEAEKIKAKLAAAGATVTIK